MEEKNEIKKEIQTNKENNIEEKTNKIGPENKKEEKDLKEKEIKRPSPWIFLQGENLQGFHTTFILMIIIPISMFFIIRTILNKFNFTKNQQDVFGVIGVLVSVWLILISYAIYYFKDDFYTVFCKKKEEEKNKEKKE